MTITNWRKLSSWYMDFADDWDKILVSSLSRAATGFKELTIAVPVRYVVSTHDVYLDAPKSNQTSELEDKGNSFMAKEFKVVDRALSMRLQIKSKNKPDWSYNSFDYYIVQDGKRVATPYSMSTSINMSGDVVTIEAQLRGHFQSPWKKDQPCQLQVSWPDQTKNEEIRFEFKDLILP